MPELLLGGRWLLALILAGSGIAKLLAPTRAPLVDAIERYGVLPKVLVRPFGLALPWIELALGAALACGILIVPVAVCAAGLLTLFALVIGWHVSRGRRFDCGCGHGGQISWQLVARDLALAGLAAWVAAGPSGGLALWAGPGAEAVNRAAVSLLPVPLFVVVVVVALQLLIGARQLWPGHSGLPAVTVQR